MFIKVVSLISFNELAPAGPVADYQKSQVRHLPAEALALRLAPVGDFCFIL
jgi:hypothetical protein